ncbi:facilitated trehalose transporter Tret1-like [Arctopsyche grandis]|uniref:facilitated trehalose transporter Tret1-like n=1 Tax=Arctopsyche grandis TaxID=121162 RepID=UPI00406D7968
MAEGRKTVQYAAGICATLTMVYQGIVLGWPSPMIPKLLSGEAGIDITKEQCSWVASLVAFGATPGCIIAQYLGDKIGRKKTILIVAFPCAFGSLMTIFVSTPLLLYIARFISGMGSAIAVVVVSIYIGEISDKQIRGALGTLLTTMANMGNVIIYTVGPFVSYTTLNIICLLVPITFFIACTWIPESPYYYLKIDKFDEAGKEMMKLKSLKTMETIENDLIQIQKHVKRDMEKKTSVVELLKKKEYRKAVIILAGLKILQQLTGTLVIQSYLETILRQTTMKISGAVGSAIYGVVQLIAGICSAIFVDRMGRKPLLFASSLGTGISLTAVGVYFYIQNVVKADVDTMSSISWLPIFGLVGFNVLYSIGLGNLPYVLQSEIFPTNVKSAASSIMTIFGATMAAIVTKMYQGLADTFGIHSVFWMFAAVSYIGVFFVYFVVPETKGKTLEEIQRKLNNISEVEILEETLEAVPLQDGKH